MIMGNHKLPQITEVIYSAWFETLTLQVLDIPPLQLTCHIFIM